MLRDVRDIRFSKIKFVLIVYVKSFVCRKCVYIGECARQITTFPELHVRDDNGERNVRKCRKITDAMNE